MRSERYGIFDNRYRHRHCTRRFGHRDHPQIIQETGPFMGVRNVRRKQRVQRFPMQPMRDGTPGLMSFHRRAGFCNIGVKVLAFVAAPGGHMKGKIRRTRGGWIDHARCR
jgi:hypothetical protein